MIRTAVSFKWTATSGHANHPTDFGFLSARYFPIYQLQIAEIIGREKVKVMPDILITDRSDRNIRKTHRTTLLN